MDTKLKDRISVDEADVERFSRIADEWWDENGKFAPLHRLNPCRIGYLRDQAMSHFGTQPASPLHGLSVLDVGCGGGLIAEPMCRLGGAVTGIDASEKNIAVASLHAERGRLPITYRAITAEALAGEGQSFDLVLALEIVEHVADVPHFLNSLTRLTKPGGLLVLSTLNRTLKSLLMAKIGAEYILRWLPVGTHDWNQFLRPSELVQPLEANGMQLVEMTGMVYSPRKREWRIDKQDLNVNYLLTMRQKDADF